MIGRAAPGIMTSRVFEDETNVLSGDNGMVSVLTNHEKELIGLYYKNGFLLIYDLDVLSLQLAQLYMKPEDVLNALADSFQIPLLRFNLPNDKFLINLEIIFNSTSINDVSSQQQQ